jgi:hypothetical protein
MSVELVNLNTELLIRRAMTPVREVGQPVTGMPWGLKDGALVTVRWDIAQGLDGRVFVANGGSATTPITWAGAYDADAPDIAIDVPAGTTILPLSIQAHLESAGAALSEFICLASPTSVGTVTYTGGALVTPRCTRISDQRTSQCKAYAAVDAAGCTDPNTAGSFEFFRTGYPTDPDVTLAPTPNYYWSMMRDGPCVKIIGPGSLCAYVGNAGTGFWIVSYVELGTGEV